MAGECGLREGEIAAMRRSWVDPNTGDVSIPISDGLWKPKTPEGARVVPVSMLSARAWESVLYFFKYETQVGVTTRTLRYRLTRMGRLANVDTFMHALRATAATNISTKVRGDIHALMTVMGWTKADVARLYLKRSAEYVKRALER
jgi:integrase